MASEPTPSSSKPTTSSPKPKPDRVKQYKSVFQKMSRRYGYMFRHLKQSFMPRKDFKAISEMVHQTLKKVAPLMVDKTTNDIIKKNISKVVADIIISKRQKVTNDVANTVPPQIKFKRHVPLVEPYSMTIASTRDHEDHHDDHARPKGGAVQKDKRLLSMERL
ncbi:hypothetical protein Tco_1137519 [Tanacetum coccineum]